MTNDQIVAMLAHLAASGEAVITGLSLDAVVKTADQVVACWPGCTYEVTPDPVGGRRVVTLRARFAERSVSERLAHR